MEYSRVQTLKAHKSHKIVLSYTHVIVLWKLRTCFEISAWNGSFVKRVLKMKLLAWQVLKFWGFTVIGFFKRRIAFRSPSSYGKMCGTRQWLKFHHYFFCFNRFSFILSHLLLGKVLGRLQCWKRTNLFLSTHSYSLLHHSQSE